MASPSGQSLSCFNTPRLPVFSKTGITEKIGEIEKRVVNIHKNGIFPAKCSRLEEAVNYFLDNGSQPCRWRSGPARLAGPTRVGPASRAGPAVRLSGLPSYARSL